MQNLKDVNNIGVVDLLKHLQLGLHLHLKNLVVVQMCFTDNFDNAVNFSGHMPGSQNGSPRPLRYFFLKKVSLPYISDPGE